MRYVLTHMWRFLVIILSVAIYTDILLSLRRRFKNSRFLGPPRRHVYEQPLGDVHGKDTSAFSGAAQSAASVASHDRAGRPQPPAGGVMVARSFTCQESHLHANWESSPSANPAIKHNPAVTEAQMQKIFLLNAYPIMYIILWIPGIANRIAEASGHSSRVVNILMASTQYVGLANAITYG